MINGEFGSIVYVIVGVFVGLSGAVSHCLLVRSESFKRRSIIAKAAILWVGAMILPISWAVRGALDSHVPVGKYYLAFFSGGIALFALVAAICISMLEARSSV
jgi:hypothetical protein